MASQVHSFQLLVGWLFVLVAANLLNGSNSCDYRTHTFLRMMYNMMAVTACSWKLNPSPLSSALGDVLLNIFPSEVQCHLTIVSARWLEGVVQIIKQDSVLSQLQTFRVCLSYIFVDDLYRIMKHYFFHLAECDYDGTTGGRRSECIDTAGDYTVFELS